MPDYKEYCEEIKNLWDNRWLTNMGEKHQDLQKKLEDFLEAKHVTLFTNGHLALENAITALGMDVGGEIITTPFTFASTTHAIVRSGFKPVFCDINPIDYTIDVNKLERLITSKTVAILPVHVYGNICNVERIEEIARRYDLKIIYDAAHAFGAKYKGVSAACFGDMVMYSFHATKVFNTIEGGALCYKDNNFVKILELSRDFGIESEEEVTYIGGNAKMNEFQAAMGICNLRHIREEIEKRKKVVNRYIDRLSNIEGIKLCEISKDIESNYAYFPVLFNGYKYDRNEIKEKLKQNDIGARKYFYPLTSNFACYHNYFVDSVGEVPVAEFVSKHILTLPLYADLSIEDVDRICNIILEK